MEKKWKYNETVHQLFVDFKKTYDSVKRKVLYNILIEFGVPIKSDRPIKMCLNENYSKVHICKHFSYISYSKWSKTNRCFIAIAFQLCFRICHAECQENQVGLKLYGTHHLLVYADDINLLGDNIDIIKKNTETLIDASKEVGLEVNTVKPLAFWIQYLWRWEEDKKYYCL
jgi:hypothetical protein